MKLLRETKIVRRNNNRNHKYGIFLCDICGEEHETTIQIGKKAKSCGCKNGMFKHGMGKTRLFGIWSGMRQRCNNINNPRYSDWGGRGIKICIEWNEFTNFMEWALKNGYSDELQIDRIDNDGNYDQSNCRFVTSSINNQNTSHTKLDSLKADDIIELYSTGEYSQRALAKIYDVHQHTIWSIVNKVSWRKS